MRSKRTKRIFYWDEDPESGRAWKTVGRRVERHADRHRHRVTGIRRNEFLQKLAKFVGRRDDLGDGELHRLCVSARGAVLPKRKHATIDGR
jgi:hypothetical protein